LMIPNGIAIAMIAHTSAATPLWQAFAAATNVILRRLSGHAPLVTPTALGSEILVNLGIVEASVGAKNRCASLQYRSNQSAERGNGAARVQEQHERPTPEDKVISTKLMDNTGLIDDFVRIIVRNRVQVDTRECVFGKSVL
jgi:hypothetical protein